MDTSELVHVLLLWGMLTQKNTYPSCTYPLFLNNVLL